MNPLLGGSAPVVSLCAPVGYGKATLLTQYATASGRPVAWISLDAADDDPALLVLEIATALDPIVPIDGRVFRLLTAAGLDAPTTVAPILLNAIAAGPDVVLLVDDLPLVSELASLGVLSFISEHLPVGSRLVVASREALPLPLGRLRARGLVLELGPGDLALDRSEANALLEEAGSHVEQDAFEALFERMEGWAAGFYLAALSLRDATDRNSTAREFAGDDRDVVDYFASEVFAPACRAPLVPAANIHARPLYGALVRRRVAAARLAQIIDELERSNFFLVPLDHRRDWYRYHHLFSSVLRAPNSHGGSRDSTGRCAAAPRSTAGDDRGAVEHALAAGDWRRAAELYATHVRLFFVAGRQATLRRWLGGVPRRGRGGLRAARDRGRLGNRPAG
jgi:LuxR family maltose regulon positive regulatory protein